MRLRVIVLCVLLIVFTVWCNQVLLSQNPRFTLCYDRLSFYAENNEGLNSIRCSSDGNQLLLANYRPGMLLRSQDGGNSFDFACTEIDYVRVEEYKALFQWNSGASMILGGSLAQTSGVTALTSNNESQMLDFSFSSPGGKGVFPPIRSFEPGAAIAGDFFITKCGASWQRKYFQSPTNYDWVFSSLHGFIGRNIENRSWLQSDLVSDTWQQFNEIPPQYERLRSSENGTLIGFSTKSIGWRRPGDTAFREQELFAVPSKSNPVSLDIQIQKVVTWRGGKIFCLATRESDWYLLTISNESVEAIQLYPSQADSHFQIENIDELGCLVSEYSSSDQAIGYSFFDKGGHISFKPEFVRYGNPTSHVTFSDTSAFIVDFAGRLIPPYGHLFRSRKQDPRLEHIGGYLRGNAAINKTSMPWCVLDTLHGALIGRDIVGAVMEFEVDNTMRGFLIANCRQKMPETSRQMLELSTPDLLVLDTQFVVRTYDAGGSGANSGTASMYSKSSGLLNSLPYSSKSAYTMTQRGGKSTLFFGRRDIVQATYDGAVLDTIPVALPDEKQDSIGVLSDIIELDSMNLVVALKGYKSRNYDGDSLGVVRGGIIRTTDRGVTWQRASVPTNDQAHYSMQQLKSAALLAVSVDAAILTDTVTKTNAVRYYSGNILRTTDQGATWTSQKSFALNNTSLTQCTWRIWQGNERIYIATPEAVMISTDDGVTWTAENDFPLNCIINGVAEYKGQLYVATTMGIYRENAQTSVTEQAVRDQPAIQAAAMHSGQAWRITVTGLPTSRILGIDVYDIQGRQHPTEQLWSQDNTASITSPLPSNGVYGVVVNGPNGQRWTTAVGAVE